METVQKLVEALKANEPDEKFIAQYKHEFKFVVENVAVDDLLALLAQERDLFIYIAPLVAGALFHSRKYQQLHDFVYELDMYGQDRSFDFFVSRLVKYYYYSLKYLNECVTPIYRIYSSNKEYGNKHTVAAATNAILDYQINHGMYEILVEEIHDNEEKALYLYYIGYIRLVRGEYSEALKLLDECDILNKSSSLALRIKKLIIICKLHLCDFTIFYPYQDQLKPYFSLIGCVKRGDVKGFYALLDEYQSEYFHAGVYMPVRSVLKVLVEVGLHKIAACYSRIRISDISEILGFNVGSLLFKTIKEGEIKGFVQEGVFYSQQEQYERRQCGDQIRQAISIRKNIESKMRYPEIVPLTYEKIFDKEETK